MRVWLWTIYTHIVRVSGRTCEGMAMDCIHTYIVRISGKTCEGVTMDYIHTFVRA